MSAPQHARARVTDAVAATRSFAAKVRRRTPLRAERRRLLRELTVTQHDRLLTVVVTPDPAVLPLALWSRSDETGEWTRHAAFDAAGEHYTSALDLGTLPRPTPAPAGTAVDSPAPSARSVLYVEIDRTLAATETGAAEGLGEREDVQISTGPDGSSVAHYRIALARAARTDLGVLTETDVDGTRIRPYVTERGGLAVVSDRDLAPYGSLSVRYFGVHGGRLRLRGRLATRHSDVTSAELVLKGRNTDFRVNSPATATLDTDRVRRRYGQRWYRVSVDFDCAPLLDDPAFGDDTYDLWLSVTTAQRAEPHSIRVGRTRFLVRQITRGGWAQNGDRAVAIAPYYTFKAKRTSLQVNLFDVDTYQYLRRATRTRHLDRLRHRGREVWLVGERPYKAQDNGLHFFRHLRENHPEIDAYYVIEKDSPERENVEPLGNVVDFKSKEHIRATLLANTVAGTHHAEFLFPTRSKQFARTIRATRVFLQHGVMGAKWTADLYHKRSGFDTDAFVVSSARERDLIVRDFGFEPHEVANTGLARFDALFADDVPVNPHQVLIMPTWRWYLQDADAYPESDYHRTWTAFLHDPRLRALEEQYQLELVLALHPNMYQFRQLFMDTPVRLVSQGEVDIQRLLKQSALLITDYSSVGWDFSFLDKPVIFYQFDRNRLARPHIEPDEELPGPIPLTANALFRELEQLAATGFAITDEYRARAARFVDHRDRNNSERIYQHARALKPGRNIVNRVASHEVVPLAWRHIRRSKYYIPVMRRLFRLFQLLPMDPKLIVFEAGMGRQYADSPRYVYEELLRRDNDFTKVWSYTGRLPHADENTKLVSRHSPAFYWYVARAKYWVNNQNFPYYVTRRPGATYLQTWHGTPLKKMLHDLDEVHGRDDGYLDRVSTMVKQWSALLSPSPYATEAMRGAFRYDGEILELGYPRNDVFYAPDRDLVAARIRRRFNIRDDQRVILYAPTFRDDQTAQPGAFTFELPIDLERFHETFGESTVLLLRMHVHVRSRITIPEHLKHLVFNVSSYPEIQHLYLAADVLITDYSSVFFDYAALRRPILFYAYDLEHYRDVLRGFYLDYERDVPGAIVTSEDDLLHALANLDEVDAPYQADRDKFLDRFAPWDDGAAAGRVVDRIFGPDPD